MAFKLLLVTCLVSSVLSQAPGDGDSLCVDPVVDNGTALVPNPFFNQRPPYPANVRPLMDSRDYLALIEQTGAVWQQVDNDTSNSGGESTSWDQQTGSICGQSVQVCGFTIGPQNNWLITQHISRQLSDGRLLDRVSVQVEFELNGCDVSRQCRQSFEVFRWDTSDNDSIAARNLQNYMFVDRISPEDTSGTVRTNASLTMDLTSVTETGLYLALVDRSTCIIVHRLLVFYYVCPEETANLITRPETLPPEPTVAGECVENSSPTNSDKPIVSCTADMGMWTIIIGCVCDPGFQGVTEDGDVTGCSECPAGTYSDSVSNSPCQSCPDNSEATQTGLSECPCVQNHYRAPDEGAGEACTRPPSRPLDVSVSNVTDTSAVLSWLPPEDDGGRDRSEIHYTVTATGTGASAPVSVRANDTMATVTGLTPFINYAFSVISENAVSSQATDTSSRSSTVYNKTMEGVAGTVTDVEPADSNTVSWSPPDPPNGVILHYNIRITHSESGELERLIEVFEGTELDVSEHVDSNDDYIVQVQAVTTVGAGNFSSPVIVTVRDTSSESNNTPLIGIAVAIVAVIIILTIIAVLLITYIVWYRRHVKGKTFYDGEVIELPRTGHRNYVDPTTYAHVDEAVQDFTVEIPPKSIRLTEEIGAGEFGTVYRGVWKTEKKDQLPIAVKTLKTGSSTKVRSDFLTEASIMGQFDHPNVIKLYGVVTRVEPIMIVMEYMEKGSLYNYLRRNDEQFSSVQLVKLALGVARGMEYLSTVGYVHRDLAARNILVDRDETPKVADFGLSRETEDENYEVKKGGKIPVRWTAPEAIAYRKFTFSSDVWSFGVLLWEVMSYGQQPYEDWDNQTVLDKVEAGHRLQKPKDCPDTVYKCMVECWTADHRKRPTFSQVVRILEILLEGNLADRPRPKPRPRKAQASQRQDHSPLEFQTVDEWLESIKMSRYSDKFQQSGKTTIQDCMALTADDLNAMGITLAGHQNKIISSIRLGREELNRQKSVRI